MNKNINSFKRKSEKSNQKNARNLHLIGSLPAGRFHLKT